MLKCPQSISARRSYQSDRTFVFTTLSLAVLTAVAMAGPVPNPTVSGSIPSAGFPGDQEHDYTFFASDHDLPVRNYVEEEFFIQGTASRYNTPDQATGSVIDSGHPYMTRVVVRRPAEAKQFNGTVLVE